MNLLSLATMGMAPVPSSGGGGGNDKPPPEANITIQVDATTRQPKAEPVSAWVDRGGKVRWECPEQFDIILKLLWTGDTVTRSAKKVGDAYVLEVTAGNIDGRYSYGISVKGGAVDPDVIIGPKIHNL
ncbi:hypothetical protein [Lysobacter solisilvae (ex Woo and Kim 2020)]|uniref:Uncharacterized protein n=1 Tax=Agrilutibacter terrestris TaxID=2865112 RepID=A0A7H0FW32_9GAMM|nr:hypothetical protein [Lysobacter terrestris]QNP40248.1 hypothetical protein H8B22_12240 [Lysobacter terrestris]